MSFRRLKRAFGYGSPSPERDATGRVIRRRTASPPPLSPEELARIQAEEDLVQQRLQQREDLVQQRLQQREASQFAHNEEVNMIIDNLNQYLYSFFGREVYVDEEDPNIRFLIGMIVTSNSVRRRLNVAQKLARSKLLLQAVANVIINIAKRSGRELRVWLPIILSGLSYVGRFLLQAGMATGRAALNTGSRVGSRVVSYFNPLEPEVQGRAASPPRGFQQSMQNMASVAYESIATGLREFYNALSSVLQHVYDLLAPCVASGASRAFNALCRHLTPQQAVKQAVNEVVDRDNPQQEEEEEESICAICMEGEENGRLGYIAVHNPPLDNHATGYIDTGHPNRFHRLCLQGCGNKCPMCRANPVWGLERRRRQAQGGGGGSRKTRSKSKSKTRRLRKSRNKSRNKPRKSRKQKSSSYRRK
jgi:hypothetical protein